MAAPATNGSRISLSSHSMQHEDGKRRQPEHDLPLERHAVAFRRLGTRMRLGARAHGPAAVVFMWRTHSAT